MGIWSVLRIYGGQEPVNASFKRYEREDQKREIIESLEGPIRRRFSVLKIRRFECI